MSKFKKASIGMAMMGAGFAAELHLHRELVKDQQTKIQ